MVEQRGAEDTNTGMDMDDAYRPKVTFVLPSLNRSGGTRVTVRMGNLLRERGYDVRLAVKAEPRHRPSKIKQPLRSLYLRIGQKDHEHWGREFTGTIETYAALGDLVFERGEVLIAIGTYTIEDVRQLERDVIKIRSCHGFAADKPQLTDQVWGGHMNTIAVSSTLVPKLTALGGPFLGVVPNGIDSDDYFDMGVPRAGIGMVYGTHYNKAPDDARTLIVRIRQRWPWVPLHVFGESLRPPWLGRRDYKQYPSIPQARLLYNRSLIWLVVSRMEGLPGPVLEAMSCGCAVISSDNVGSREVIENGKNGILVPIGDIEGFMRSVKLILTDSEARLSLAANGAATAREFTWDRAVERMEQVLHEAVRGYNSARSRQTPSGRNSAILRTSRAVAGGH